MDHTGRKPRRIGRADAVIVAGVLALAALLWILSRMGTATGASAIVTTPEKQETVALSRNTRWSVGGKDGIEVTLEVNDGRIRFVQSGCPDQICVQSGWLSQAGQTAACLPAGVAVRVAGDSPVDMIAG